MNQLDLFQDEKRHPSFDGETMTDETQKRQEASMDRIYQLMSDGRGHTLREMARVGRCSENAASARFRDFRKAKFKLRYPCKEVPKPKRIGPGLYEYRLVME